MKTETCKELDVLISSTTINKRNAENKFTLPPLPYAENGLEPYISARTLQFHHGKHLAAYINNMNGLIAGTRYENMCLEGIVMESDGGLFNNAAQTYNHLFYFEALRPHDAAKAVPTGKIASLIDASFGNFETFKETFTKAASTLFGSGWAWLTVDKDGKLAIEQTANADTPLRHGKKPLLTIDVWEHAYYLDTQNARPRYIENFWNIINWDIVNQRLR